jgi:hypothetical protein
VLTTSSSLFYSILFYSILFYSIPFLFSQFYQLSAEHCLSDASAQLGRAKDQLASQGRELMGALMFSCGGRGPHPFAGKAMMDAEAFKEAFPSAPMTGFYAGGEIGPQAMADASGQIATQTGNAALQGFTAVFGLFSVPIKLKRDGSFLPSTIDTSPGALASYLAGRETPMDEVKRNAAAAAEKAAAARAAAVPTAEAIESGMSVKQLRTFIASAGLSFGDCIEKDDLRGRAKEAASILLAGANGPPPPPPSP